MRDGLSLLDQCATATVGELTAERVYQCLGIAGEQRCAELMGYIARHDTHQALELFNRLYADGKDLSALLDEMACLCRDLLILKTAPNAGITMLSGVASDQEAKKLTAAFSGGELVRMMELIEQTMAGFTRSSSRRLDAELCLMRLCQPELHMDAASLNARISRLEEQLKTGNFTVPKQTAPATVMPEQQEDELPPLPDDSDAPPEETPTYEMPPQQAPVGFWPDLVAAVRQELRPPASGFFTPGPNGPVQGGLKGNQVVLKCANPFTLEMINKPELLALVARKASAILGRNVSVIAVDTTAMPENSARMEQLMNFGRAHSDVIKIKE